MEVERLKRAAPTLTIIRRIYYRFVSQALLKCCLGHGLFAFRPRLNAVLSAQLELILRCIVTAWPMTLMGHSRHSRDGPKSPFVRCYADSDHSLLRLGSTIGDRRFVQFHGS